MTKRTNPIHFPIPGTYRVTVFVTQHLVSACVMACPHWRLLWRL